MIFCFGIKGSMMKQITYEDFLRLLQAHQPVQIAQAHIEQAEKHEGYEDEQFLEKITANYPSHDTRTTGGYLLPGKILPWRFRSMLVARATGMQRHGRENFMVDEILLNGLEHGNGQNADKNIHLLWHRCSHGIEIHVVDKGEAEFNLDERIQSRRALVASFGKGDDDYSGTDVLRAYSKEFEYFTILSEAGKKGTLVRIVLEQFQENVNGCSYIGHQLFA